MSWEVLHEEPPNRWKIGLWVWRKDGEWRLRLYRPWSKERLIEVQCDDLLLAFYILGIVAGWWKDVVFNDSEDRS